MQHDVLAFLDLQHALDPQQQALQPLRLVSGELLRRLDDRGAALEDRCRLVKLVRAQRGAARHEIADEVGFAETRRDLHRARERDDLRLHAVALQIIREDAWIRGRDALALQLLRPCERHAGRQVAAAQAPQAPRAAQLEAQVVLRSSAADRDHLVALNNRILRF